MTYWDFFLNPIVIILMKMKMKIFLILARFSPQPASSRARLVKSWPEKIDPKYNGPHRMTHSEKSIMYA